MVGSVWDESGRDPDQVAEYRTDEIQQLREQVHRRDVLLREREDEIEDLHERLAQYNTEIQEQFGRVARRDIRVQELRAQDPRQAGATSDDLIRWAKGQQGGEASRYLQGLIQRRNEQLEQLHRQVAERDNEITQLHERAARRNEEITLQALQADQIKAPFQRTSWQDADLQRVHLELAEVRLALAAAEKATASGRNIIAAQAIDIAQLTADKDALQRALDVETDSSDSTVSEEDTSDGKLGIVALQEGLSDVAAEQGHLQRALAAAVRENSTRWQRWWRGSKGHEIFGGSHSDSPERVAYAAPDTDRALGHCADTTAGTAPLRALRCGEDGGESGNAGRGMRDGWLRRSCVSDGCVCGVDAV
ncbi:hypothetical protein B484DRAFT_403468 [Ochromonadaceae sp. CCMP2298]|nr:hypothetical protein B484DRAFT_403468 [Ochromonadaceae sp. CCMP2298]